MDERDVFVKARTLTDLIELAKEAALTLGITGADDALADSLRAAAMEAASEVRVGVS